MQTRGWQTGLFSLYGRLVVKKYKTFLATYKPVGGVIRVVLVCEPDRWVAYFSTDPDLSVASILETVADRSGVGAGLPRRQGGARSGTAAVASCVGQRGGVEPDRLVAHAGGAVGLGLAGAPGRA